MRLDAETAHELTLKTLKIASRSRILGGLENHLLDSKVPSLPVKVFGKNFRNPVGLAAGFDKDAIAYNSLASFGFGFVELGTVTPQPQLGNPRKRLFRVPEDYAIINRLGFNSSGLEVFKRNLRSIHTADRPALIGINIGKNTVTPIDFAAHDYLRCLEEIYDLADYVTINVSSPNSPNLRDLQSTIYLDQLLESIMQKRNELAQTRSGQVVPVALKISPDLTEFEINSIAEIALRHDISAIIATNTTISRPESSSHLVYSEPGGLSGRPLIDLSTRVIRTFAEASNHRIPIIGVGGIFSAEDAWQKILAGASLVQIYSSLIYKGPSVVREIVLGLSDRARQFGAKDFNTALKFTRDSSHR